MSSPTPPGGPSRDIKGRASAVPCTEARLSTHHRASPVISQLLHPRHHCIQPLPHSETQDGAPLVCPVVRGGVGGGRFIQAQWHSGSDTGAGAQNTGICGYRSRMGVSAGVPHPDLRFPGAATLHGLLNPTVPQFPYPGTVAVPISLVKRRLARAWHHGGCGAKPEWAPKANGPPP